MEKIDRILMSCDWESLYPLVTVRKQVRELSDHNPLLLSSGDMDREAHKPREFRFDLAWLKNEDFLPLVEKIWNKAVKAEVPIVILNIKLKRF